MSTLSTTGSTMYNEMASWIGANSSGTLAEIEGMVDLLECLEDHCVAHQGEWEAEEVAKREQELISPPRAPKIRSINWHRRLEEFKRNQIEEANLADEEEAAQLAFDMEEANASRIRTAELLAVRNAELKQAKLAKKNGTFVAGVSMADRLKLTWASAPTPEEE